MSSQPEVPLRASVVNRSRYCRLPDGVPETVRAARPTQGATHRFRFPVRGAAERIGPLELHRGNRGDL